MGKCNSCIIFSTADWCTPYWTNKQHTAMEMAKRGMQVLYIESIGLRQPNMSSKDLRRILLRIRNGIKGIRQVQQCIWIYAPLAIPFGHHYPWMRRFNQRMLRIGLERYMRQHHLYNPMIWTYHPFMLESIAGLGTGPLVYHCVDDLSAIPGIDAKAFIKEERRLLHCAQVVFTTTRALYDKCSKYNGNVYDYPNVVDFDHFSRAFNNGPLPKDLASIPEPRIGYIGALSDYKIDFALLKAVAEIHCEWHFVLIGEEREGQDNPIIKELNKLPNVHLLGYRSYRSLPSYLRGMRVGLLPTLINNYTRSMFPMKYFEYIAAGVPIVSTSLPFTRQHYAATEVANDHEEFSAAIDKQLGRGKLSIQEAKLFIGANTWQDRLDKMIESVMAL